MKKLILFDLDGTLTDPSEGITKSIVYALKHYGIEEKPENCLKYIGPPLGPALEEDYGVPGAAAVQKFRERFEKKGIYENILFEETIPVLAELKKRGHILCLATSKPQFMAERVLSIFGLTKYFDGVYGATADESKVTKADIIHDALAAHPGLEAFMIGDRKHDIKGAKANGITSIGIHSGFGDPDELEKAGADIVLDNLTGLLSLADLK